MIRSVAVAVAVAFTGSAGSAFAAEATPALRRFALVAGANDGGAGRVRLRYATSDAEAVARVLEELGGVSRADRLLLLDPDRGGFDAALRDVAGRVAAARGSAQRVELIVYYSGHSDDEGLLLRGERVGYADLRQALAAVPVDVRVAILDSCSSGALTRRKGGVRRPPFLVDRSSEVRGHAFLTSSSEHEAAQESDRIRASYFTHYLISGLRGGADVTPDGRVTLNEAYQFAFAETLRQTERTKAGPQHPAYDIQLQGTGDLVMTDLRATTASLVVDTMLSGRLYVRDADDRLAAELFKPAGRSVELGLSPGRYSVRLDHQDELFEVEVTLTEGQRVALDQSSLTRVARELTAMRGDGAAADASLLAGAARPGRHETLETVDGRRYSVVPISFTVLPNVSTTSNDVVKNFSFNLVMGRAAYVYGLELGLGVNVVTAEVRGVQIAGGVNRVEGDLLGLQSANGANIVSGEVVGLQLAAGFNVAGGGGRLLQAAAGFNATTGVARGLQLAGGFNSADAAFTGAQAAALFNHVEGPLAGLQASGGINLAKATVTGVQASIINVAGDVSGAQIGVINIGRKVRGLQLGVLNISEDVDVPIGLFNVVEQGQLHLDLTASTDEALGAAFRLGSKHFYTLFGGGVLRREARGIDAYELRDFYVGLGLGVHLPRRDFFVDLDVFGGNPVDNLDRQGSTTLGRLRLSLGYQISAHLALFVSGALNAMVGVEEDRPEIVRRVLLRSPAWVWREDDVTVRLWPGLVVGLQI